MPQLVFKGLKSEDVQMCSRMLLEPLATLCQTPKDYFTFECVNSNFFFNGQEMEMYPLIEVIQFDRGQEIEKEMVKIIQDTIFSLGHQECEVYFTHISQENYHL